MQSLLKLSVVILTLLFCLTQSEDAAAEWFADAYLGGSHTSASNNRFQIAGTTVRDLEDSDVSTPGGVRLGYWFERYSWVGLALDFSVFDPNFDDTATSPGPTFEDVTLGVRPLSALIMVRLPLRKSPEFPMGRLQPYIGVGPGLFWTTLSEPAGSTVLPPAVLEDMSLDLGIDLRAGVTALIRSWVGIFLEYRYTQFKSTLDSETGSGLVKYEPTLRTNYALFGVTFRFGYP